MAEISEKSLPELVFLLGKKHSARPFPAFVKSLRLHSFKNIADLTEIRFEFPVTALIGANGCGKSSVLQALYGCPEGYSLGRYWFSTKLDPISDESGSRPYLVYGYTADSGEYREVVKTRIKWNKKEGASKNLDYWEPSRPIKKLGMQILPGGSRHPAIVKEVMVIDFRYQLSAFDRYFYLEEVEPYHAKKRRSQQDVIRMRSEAILLALSGVVRPKRAEPVHELSSEQCRIISRILGKRYRAGKILHHRFHGFWADTVVFESESCTNTLKYTEANAGSGEVAVTLMVHKLSAAKVGSLVLLDEPEYSLHPGAQRELLRFLLAQCAEKQLQIVFTTHAPAMVEGLPTSAIKVFEQDSLTDKFVVRQDRSVEEAFLSIGQRNSGRATVRVEDALAKELLEEVLKRMASNNAIPADFSSLVDIKYYPGGVSSMKQDAAQYSRDAMKNVFVVFDGTERPSSAVNLLSITVAENTVAGLTSKLLSLTKENVAFATDGGSSGGRDDQRLEAIKAYIQFWNNRVRFLPFDVPEAEIWDEQLARNELEAVCAKAQDVETHISKLRSMNAKQRFAHLSEVISNRSKSEHIIAVQIKFLKSWMKNNPASLGKIESLLLEIRRELSSSLKI